VVFPRLVDANQSRTYERSRTEFAAYRFAYLLLPLQHVWHRVVAGKFHVAVEHNWLAQDGGDMDRILVANPCKHTIVTSNLEPLLATNEIYRTEHVGVVYGLQTEDLHGA
jgi:hypothetical protein